MALKPRKELELLGFQPMGKCYGGCGDDTQSYFASGHDAAFARNVAPILRELVKAPQDENPRKLVKTYSGSPKLKQAVQRLNNLPEDT